MSQQRNPYQTSNPPQATGQCTAVIGALTKAMQAEQLLSHAAIPAHIIKVSSQKGGCVYGVILSCTQSGIAKEVLAREGIHIRRFLS